MSVLWALFWWWVACRIWRAVARWMTEMGRSIEAQAVAAERIAAALEAQVDYDQDALELDPLPWEPNGVPAMGGPNPAMLRDRVWAERARRAPCETPGIAPSRHLRIVPRDA